MLISLMSTREGALRQHEVGVLQALTRFAPPPAPWVLVELGAIRTRRKPFGSHQLVKLFDALVGRQVDSPTVVEYEFRVVTGDDAHIVEVELHAIHAVDEVAARRVAVQLSSEASVYVRGAQHGCHEQRERATSQHCFACEHTFFDSLIDRTATQKTLVRLLTRRVITTVQPPFDSLDSQGSQPDSNWRWRIQSPQ